MGNIFHKRTRKAMDSASVITEVEKMEHGEIAVNFRKGDECLFFKNSAGSLKKIMSDSFNRDKFLSHDNPNFKQFETKVEFQAAFDAGEIVYPCVSYIVDTNEYHYMTPPMPETKYHLRAEADYAAEDYEILTSIMGELPDFISLGYIPLYMGMPLFTSFKVNGEEMIDAMTSEYPGLGDMGIPMILVPFEEGAIWDIIMEVPEGGFYISSDDPEMEYTISSFLRGNCFAYAPYTEIFYNDTMYKFFTSDEIATESVNCMPFFFGMYYGGLCIKKITYTGDFPYPISNATSDQDLEALAQYALYATAGNGVYSRLSFNPTSSSPIEFCIPAGNTTYGNPNDIANLNTGEGCSVYGVLNSLIQSGELNFDIIITEY